MQMTRIHIENFRTLDGFTFDFSGKSYYLVGENATGKSSLITAIVRALGKDRAFERDDFQNLNRAIDIRVTLTDLDASQIGVFADVADFGTPTSVTIGVMAVWDEDEEEIEITHGYPTKAWQASKRSEREAIEVYWISDNRNPSRLLQFSSRKGLISDAIADLDLEQPISQAIDEIGTACLKFASVPDLRGVMQNVGQQLRKLVAANAEPYGVGSAASSDVDVLRQLQLTLDYNSGSLPLTNQSAGLIQLTLFAFSLYVISQRPGSLLLVDEPELSLHPQAQKALVKSIQQLPNQFLLTTHSAPLIERADARHIVRLYRDGLNVNAATPTELTKQEAMRLARFTTTENAESFFARTVVLVEGQSDKYALEAAAAKKDRNLDADGVTIVAMRGAGSFETFLRLLGPNGLKVKLSGLCDANEEAKWARALEEHGFGANLGRTEMASLGFHVCDKDLEDVLIAAVGENETLALIESSDDKTAFSQFAQQPTQKSKALSDLLHDFIHSRGRNITYAPLLVDQLDSARLPTVLEQLINEL